MIAHRDKRVIGRVERETLRKDHAAPAWSLWTALARNDVMADSADRDRMMERHRLVVAMIEVNSQQLRCDSQAAGLDIELLNAQRDVEQSGGTAEARAAQAEIERRQAGVEAKKRKLAQERDWLETSLSEFDALLRAKPDKPISQN